MKTNQADQDADRIETTQLAAFGLLVGGVMTAFLFLALILSSIPGPKKDAKPEIELAAAPQATLATNGAQRQPGIVDSEQSKSRTKSSKPRKRTLLNYPTLRTSGHSNVYRTSVAPGKTPKMIQVQ